MRFPFGLTNRLRAKHSDGRIHETAHSTLELNTMLERAALQSGCNRVVSKVPWNRLQRLILAPGRHASTRTLRSVSLW